MKRSVKQQITATRVFPSAKVGKGGLSYNALFWLQQLHATSDEDASNIKVVHFDETDNFMLTSFTFEAILFTLFSRKKWSQITNAMIIFIP